MKINHILLFAFLFFSLFACKKDEFKRHNDVLIGTYEVTKQEVYHYYEDYTGIDSIIVDTTYSTPVIWELTKKDSTDIKLGPDSFRLLKDDPISDWTFTYKYPENNPYLSMYYSAKIWFFPAQDSFYMQASMPDPSPEGIELISTVYTGKRQE